MFLGILQRVDFWLIWVTVILLGASGTRAHSCHEVKTAFQLRQIGSLKWVPDTPGPGRLVPCGPDESMDYIQIKKRCAK